MPDQRVGSTPHGYRYAHRLPELLEAFEQSSLRDGDPNELEDIDVLCDRASAWASDDMKLVLVDIRKSSLLGRLIYEQERFRTVLCPEHRGKVSGIEWESNKCAYGCDFTGWLKE